MAHSVVSSGNRFLYKKKLHGITHQLIFDNNKNITVFNR